MFSAAQIFLLLDWRRRTNLMRAKGIPVNPPEIRSEQNAYKEILAVRGLPAEFVSCSRVFPSSLAG